MKLLVFLLSFFIYLQAATQEKIYKTPMGKNFSSVIYDVTLRQNTNPNTSRYGLEFLFPDNYFNPTAEIIISGNLKNKHKQSIAIKPFKFYGEAYKPKIKDSSLIVHSFKEYKTHYLDVNRSFKNDSVFVELEIKIREKINNEFVYDKIYSHEEFAYYNDAFEGFISSTENDFTPVEGAKVTAETSLGKKLTTFTNNKGKFVFVNVVGTLKNIVIELPSNCQSLFLFSAKKLKIAKLNHNKNGFAYDFLPADLEKMALQKEEEPIEGIIFTNFEKAPLINSKVQVWSNNNLIQETITDLKGRFEFLGVDDYENLKLKIENDAYPELILADANSNIITSLNKKEQSFDYQLLPPIIETLQLKEIEEEKEVSISAILIDSETGNPIVGAIVSAINKSGQVVEAISNKIGKFTLNTINSINEISIKTNETHNKISIINDEGVVVFKAINSKDNKSFTFNILGKMIHSLEPKNYDSNIEFIDGITEIEVFLNYESNAIEFDSDSYTNMDKLVNYLKETPIKELIIISHTDSNGDFDYNMELSIKRATFVKDYLQKNILNLNASIVGKGETEIRNRCVDGIECSDNEHKYNRRTEFEFKY